MTLVDELLLDVVELFEGAGIEYMVVGALAVAAHGRTRSTDDLDIAVHVDFDERDEIGDLLAEAGWPDQKVLSDEFGRRIVADLEDPYTVEVFFAAGHPLFDREFDRLQRVEYHGQQIPFISPEDLVLRKLVNTKHRRGHDFDDALSVIAVQGDRFDVEYVRDHCAAQRVCDLFERALKEARQLEPE